MIRCLWNWSETKNAGLPGAIGGGGFEKSGIWNGSMVYFWIVRRKLYHEGAIHSIPHPTTYHLFYIECFKISGYLRDSLLDLKRIPQNLKHFSTTSINITFTYLLTTCLQILNASEDLNNGQISTLKILQHTNSLNTHATVPSTNVDGQRFLRGRGISRSAVQAGKLRTKSRLFMSFYYIIRFQSVCKQF